LELSLTKNSFSTTILHIFYKLYYMGILNNRKEAYAPTQTKVLEQFFFAPKTIEGHYLLSNFTQDMVPELRRFMRFFGLIDKSW